MTTAEEVLFKQALNIIQYRKHVEDLTESENLILDQAFKILVLRFFDLFRMVFRALLVHDELYGEFMLGFVRLTVDMKQKSRRMKL